MATSGYLSLFTDHLSPWPVSENLFDTFWLKSANIKTSRVSRSGLEEYSRDNGDTLLEILHRQCSRWHRGEYMKNHSETQLKSYTEEKDSKCEEILLIP